MTLIPLTAGPLTMHFDTELAFLRYVHFAETEVLRGLFAAVRDADWNTLPFHINVLELEQNLDSFAIEFSAREVGEAPSFEWQGQLVGGSDGVVEYRFHGTALRPFRRNRIGLCVLHPSDSCAGQACQITHVDGSITNGRFPRRVSPHQPFKNIRAIAHGVPGDGRLIVTMLGDTFEMEDQRNWTDASYKTYSTPLELPFPVEVAAGEIIEQTVKLELAGAVPRAKPRGKSSVTEVIRVQVAWGNPSGHPRLGFALAPREQPLTDEVITQLRWMRPDHLRVDLWLGQSDWREELRRGIEAVRSIDSNLELAIFAEPPYQEQLRELCQAVWHDSQLICRVLLFDTMQKVTPAELLRAAREAFQLLDFPPELVVGTNVYFAELNRGRPALEDGCLVCFSINPQVHAFDKLSITETLSAQPATVDTAMEIFARHSRPAQVVVSPISLRPRFNPNATSRLDRQAELAAAIDPRQSSGYAAAWTAGVLATLATHPQVASLTLFETHGPRGVMGERGEHYAMTPLLAFAVSGRRFYPVHLDRGLHVWCCGAWSHSDQPRRVIAANLGDSPQAIELTDHWGTNQQVELDAESVRIVAWKERN